MSKFFKHFRLCPRRARKSHHGRRLSKNVTSVGQFAPCLSGNGTGRRIRNYVFEFRDHEPEFRRRDSADSREQGRRCHLAWIGGTDVVVSVPKIDAHFQTIQHVERNIMRPRVLISDELPHASVEVLEAAGCHVTYQPQLGKRDEAGSVIGAYDGLVIRSATRVSGALLNHTRQLRVIGRAGIGVDNVDIPAATARGVVVMNTPHGNSVTTAEHTIAMIMALARHIPKADAATRSGVWEKTKFMAELRCKTLGKCGQFCAGQASAQSTTRSRQICRAPAGEPAGSLIDVSPVCGPWVPLASLRPLRRDVR